MENLSAPLPGTGKAHDPVHNLVKSSLVWIFLAVYFTAEPTFMFRNEEKKICSMCDFVPLSFYHSTAKKIHVKRRKK